LSPRNKKTVSIRAFGDASPAIHAEWLGDRDFQERHGSRFAYVVGEMARGISTPQMVIAAVRAGLVGFFGTAGLKQETIATGISQIEAALGPNAPAWGANLIHAPQQPGYEAAVTDLFLARGVRRVSASAFMSLSSDIVRYSATGLTRNAEGGIERRNQVFAKVSRPELAEQFMAPAPERLLRELVAAGRLSESEADLAARIPIAADITAEADSGGHTDNRPVGPLFSSIAAARRRVCARHGLDINHIRIGVAGGIGTPEMAAAAYQLGAAYILTGSVNQSAVEAGVSDGAKRLLAEAGMPDVMMASASDMFEQGVKVQVLKRGTLFAMRANRLFDLHRSGRGFSDLTAEEAQWVEKVLGEPFDSAWTATKAYLADANPADLGRAEADPNKKMALVFRRYLFLASQWARDGTEARLRDYQIWCGPAMGAFNEWVEGSPLDPLEARTVKQIAWNLLAGAAHFTRAQLRRATGDAVAASEFEYRPVLFA